MQTTTQARRHGNPPSVDPDYKPSMMISNSRVCIGRCNLKASVRDESSSAASQAAMHLPRQGVQRSEQNESHSSASCGRWLLDQTHTL